MISYSKFSTYSKFLIIVAVIDQYHLFVTSPSNRWFHKLSGHVDTGFF